MIYVDPYLDRPRAIGLENINALHIFFVSFFLLSPVGHAFTYGYWIMRRPPGTSFPLPLLNSRWRDSTHLSTNTIQSSLDLSNYIVPSQWRESLTYIFESVCSLIFSAITFEVCGSVWYFTNTTPECGLATPAGENKRPFEDDDDPWRSWDELALSRSLCLFGYISLRM